jgi:hypothetical protein
VAGARELASIVDAHDATLLVGVSCGLSAPYVAGQLDLALKGPAPGDLSLATTTGAKKGWCGAFVVGFNGVDDARDSPIELWGSGSVRDVVRALEARATADDQGEGGWFGVLNPVVGPEAIAGSSRMKGGTATHVLLDATCFVSTAAALATAADAAAVSSSPSSPPSAAAAALLPSAAALGCGVRGMFEAHASSARAAYASVAGLAGCMESGAAALRGKGRLCFLSSHGGAGCMAFIDASEMPDT